MASGVQDVDAAMGNPKRPCLDDASMLEHIEAAAEAVRDDGKHHAEASGHEGIRDRRQQRNVAIAALCQLDCGKMTTSKEVTHAD
jgi:hypothetical protein